MAFVGENVNRDNGTFSWVVNNGTREGGVKTLSHEPRTIPQPLHGWRATLPSATGGMTALGKKHEMINSVVMKKEEIDCRPCISYRSGIARIAVAWHIASHRGCVRAVAGRQGGRNNF